MRKSNLALLSVLGLSAFALTGCKPYNSPEYEIVENYESAFVVNLDDNSDQAKVDTVEGLEKSKVSSKRILITKRWNKTGRDTLGIFENNGQWIPTVQVIKVNRNPVTRGWAADSHNAIELESSDSINYSTGIRVVAMITEQDTALFLHSCKSDNLEHIMDTVIRARVESVASRISSKYKMDELRERKNEITNAISDDLIPEMKKLGITVTSVGCYSGFNYVDQKIQDSINSVFVVQQEKATAKAKLDAVADQNKAIKELAQGQAQAVMAKAEGERSAMVTRAQGERDAKILSAESANQAVILSAKAEAERVKLQGEAEASVIQAIGKANAEKVNLITAAFADQAKANAYLESLKIDAQKTLYSKWSGNVPTWQMSGGDGKGGNQMLMILPKLPGLEQEKVIEVK